MESPILRAFSHFRGHKPSCEIRLICSYCRCAHSGSVSFPPPNRQSLKSVQSLDFVETLNFREGNDILYHLQGQLASGFKPRSHEGNDATGAVEGVTMERVSIHVPTRGTTKLNRFFLLYQIVSIHVPTRGTTASPKISRVICQFQSTFPRGERPDGCIDRVPVLKFQSTFPRGERLSPLCGDGRHVVFQSTFPRGERQNIKTA